MSLLELPLEILNYILDFLDLRERIQKRRVCKKFRDRTPNILISRDELNLIHKYLMKSIILLNIPKFILQDPFHIEMIEKTSGEIKYKTQVYVKIVTLNPRKAIFVRKTLWVNDELYFRKLFHHYALEFHYNLEEYLTEYDGYYGTRNLIYLIQNIFYLSNFSSHELRLNDQKFDRAFENYFDPDCVWKQLKELVDEEDLISWINKFKSQNNKIQTLLSKIFNIHNPSIINKYIQLCISVLFHF
jgi:hypothetical protein